jgi:hypothetical protein
MHLCSQIHIFVGPSNRIVARWLKENPDERIRQYPPARRGDLLRAPIGPKDSVLIVDGTVIQEPGPSHGEILDLLARGVNVFGAASTGALRASELTQFGMVGLGMIFEALVQGKLQDDGELVACMHPTTFQATTMPLVNLRLVLKVMGDKLNLPSTCLKRLFERAIFVPLLERDIDSISQEWASEGSEIVNVFETLTSCEECDAKSRDAMFALTKVSTRHSITILDYGPELRLSDFYWAGT